MRRALLAVVAMFALRVHAAQDVTLTFIDDGSVTITTDSPEHDDWEPRFDRITPREEVVTMRKVQGRIASIEHSATVPPDDLQPFFADLDFTLQLTRSGGFDELAIYPNTSRRATRAERTELEHRVRASAERVVAYVDAMRRLYGYLDANPGRAESVFAQLAVQDEADIVAAGEEENALLLDARHALEDVVAAAPSREEWPHVAALADRVTNPFPALITIRLPHAYESMEGFTATDRATLRANVPSLDDAIAALAERWLSPNPLVTPYEPEKAAHQPRHVALSLTVDDVVSAFMNELKPKPVYRVRWAATAP